MFSPVHCRQDPLLLQNTNQHQIVWIVQVGMIVMDLSMIVNGMQRMAVAKIVEIVAKMMVKLPIRHVVLVAGDLDLMGPLHQHQLKPVLVKIVHVIGRITTGMVVHGMQRMVGARITEIVAEMMVKLLMRCVALVVADLLVPILQHQLSRHFLTQQLIVRFQE